MIEENAQFTTKLSTDGLTDALLITPELTNVYQRELDHVRARYEKRLVTLSLRALGLPLFPGKKPEDPKRAAGNEEERKLAVQYVALKDKRLCTLRDEYNAARRNAQTCVERGKNLRLIARLYLVEKRSEE